MKDSQKRWLYWAPRILALLFAAFTSLFAFDVFDSGHTFGETLIALFMHLIPTWIVLIVLVLAWRWEGIGAILFAALGVLYIVVFWHPSMILAFVLLSGPLFLISVLFLANWRDKKMHA